MFKLYILGLPMFLASLFNFWGREEPPHKKSEAQMGKVINHSIKQLSNRYGIRAIGTGGGNVDNKSKREFVAFELHKKISKEEARILLIEIVELMLHNVNGTEEISDYLYDKPFTYRNLEFVVFIYNNDGSDLYHPDLGGVSLTPRSEVSFVTYEPTEICKRATDIRESYEEAYRIVTQRDYPTASQPASDLSPDA